MSILWNVGEVATDERKFIRWTIPRFVQLPREVDTGLVSAMFSFRGVEGCRFYAYPNGSISCNSEGCMQVECDLCALPSEDMFLSVVDKEGREILNTRTKYDGVLLSNQKLRWRRSERAGGVCYRKIEWIRRTKLETQADELLPGGHLRIMCSFAPRGSRGQRREKTASAAEEGLMHPLGSCVCDICKPSIKGLPNLTENYKDLYLQSKDTDFVIRVRGREFRAHRLILRARIPAFDAMLTHNMAENQEGVVSIEDCNPDVFNEFLLFIYSGRVENLSPDNVCGLYIIADKYALQDLKEISLSFMKTFLSIEFICDVICLAATHGETELLKLATKFFVLNAKEILVTVKWQQFLAENPTQGNELLLKTMKTTKLGNKSRQAL